jgi:acetyltransferase-like isoleucine patch superfamily enzyme
MNSIYSALTRRRVVTILARKRARRSFLQTCRKSNTQMALATIYPENYHKLHVGANVVANDAFLDTIGEITIGDAAFFGWGVKLLTGSHPVHKKGIARQHITLAKPVFVGAGVWIASYAIILPGSVIGENSVVGAGSVVRGEFPAGALIVGNPARIVKSIDFETDIETSMHERFM